MFLTATETIKEIKKYQLELTSSVLRKVVKIVNANLANEKDYLKRLTAKTMKKIYNYEDAKYDKQVKLKTGRKVCLADYITYILSKEMTENGEVITNGPKSQWDEEHVVD